MQWFTMYDMHHMMKSAVPEQAALSWLVLISTMYAQATLAQHQCTSTQGEPQ